MRNFLNFLDNPAISGLNSLRILDLISGFFAAKGDFTRLNIDTKSNFRDYQPEIADKGGVGLYCFFILNRSEIRCYQQKRQVKHEQEPEEVITV
jgi:hypothetical protein